MRRRLVLAIVGVVAGALLLAGAGTLLVVVHAQRVSARRALAVEAHSFAAVVRRFYGAENRLSVASVPGIAKPHFLAMVRAAAHLENARIIAITSEGNSLPLSPVDIPKESMRLVWRGHGISGSTANLIYAVEPVGRLRHLHKYGRIGAVRLATILTRTPGLPSLGVGYLVAVSGATLLIAAVVAVRLSSTITGPLLQAVSTTRRLAAGDLTARTSAGEGAFPELASLTNSINSMATSLARSRGLERQFLLSVSHDLRTPLTSIRGFAEAIADGTAANIPHAARIIRSESRRLERLVQDLLELSRLEARRFSLKPRAVELNEVVLDTSEGFRPTLEQVGLELRVLLPSAATWTNTDPERLAQILANLIENATKFARRLVEVRLSMATTNENQANVIIAVTDDGPGIAAEDLSHIFERLYTSARPAARESGTGLGLAIVAELAAALGATVDTVSPASDNGGTTIAIHLPRLAVPPISET